MYFVGSSTLAIFSEKRPQRILEMALLILRFAKLVLLQFTFTSLPNQNRLPKQRFPRAGSLNTSRVNSKSRGASLLTFFMVALLLTSLFTICADRVLSFVRFSTAKSLAWRARFEAAEALINQLERVPHQLPTQCSYEDDNGMGICYLTAAKSSPSELYNIHELFAVASPCTIARDLSIQRSPTSLVAAFTCDRVTSDGAYLGNLHSKNEIAIDALLPSEPARLIVSGYITAPIIRLTARRTLVIGGGDLLIGTLITSAEFDTEVHLISATGAIIINNVQGNSALSIRARQGALTPPNIRLRALPAPVPTLSMIVLGATTAPNIP